VGLDNPRMEKVRIGVFDSGVGGLSVLRALHAAWPQADLHYLADSAHAPYGERDDAFITQRSLALGKYLRDAGAAAIIVACNTATALAVTALRQAFRPMVIVGVEPGLKPARAVSRNGRIAILATAATLGSRKFGELLDRVGGDAGIHLQACHGLAAAIELGDLESPEIAALVERHCEPVRAFGADTAVLGCTHYPFARDLIAAALPGVALIDTSDAVARRVVQMSRAPLAGTDGRGSVVLETTGDPARLRAIAAAWLPFAAEVRTSSLAI
jgi:glutamate racemase